MSYGLNCAENENFDSSNHPKDIFTPDEEENVVILVRVLRVAA